MYTAEFESRLSAWAQEQQSKGRFAHTQRVVETVDRLAAHWSPEDVMLCRIAAWIHDCAKKFSDEKLLELAQHYHLPVTRFERETPMLLHGIVAYALADEQFHLDDQRLLTACAYHTSGSGAMNLTDKLLFLADKVEPDRDFPGVEEIRDLMLHDLDAALLRFIDGNLRYLMDRVKPIDPRQIEFYNALIQTQKSQHPR